MREITAVQVTVERKLYEGKGAYLVADPDTGEVFRHNASDKSGDTERARRVLVPAKLTLLVGTDAEIEAKKAECDAQFAPIKAQRDADRKAAAEAAKAARETAVKQ